jgi:hypothetical protein
MVQLCTMITPFVSDRIRLACHSDTDTRAIEGIEADVSWTRTNTLALTYALKGNLTRLHIPPPQTPRRADRLWEHTCFEAFVSVKGSSEYYEFNFAPSGEWAVYGFQHYRNGTPLEDERLAPKITVHSVARGLDLYALVRLDSLPAIPPRARLRVALSAVVEEKDGLLSYWALNHPPGKPDFHHPDAFVLELTIPEPDNVSEATLAKR